MNWLEQPISLDPLRVAALFLWDVLVALFHFVSVLVGVSLILIAATLFARVVAFEVARILFHKAFPHREKDSDAVSWALCIAALCLTVAYYIFT